MKTMKFMALFAAILLAGAIFTSCQKEESNIPVKEQGTMTLKTAYTYESCETQCIEPGSGDYYYKTDQVTVQWGNNKSKVVDIEYYNTETDFVLKVKSTEGWSDLVIDGASSWTYGPVAPNVWGTYTVALPGDWEACDDYNFTLQVTGNGPNAVFDVVYDLIGLCGCETELLGETECGSFYDGLYNRKAVYTFTTEEAGTFKLQGGLTNFTDETYLATATAGTVDSWIPGNSSNRIISVQGSLDECETVVLTIYWHSTNEDEYITGGWSVEFDGVKILEIDEMQCDDSKIGYPPLP
jgi:hypothetical protein